MNTNIIGIDIIDTKLPIKTIEATFSGSLLYCSASIKLITAGGKIPNSNKICLCISGIGTISVIKKAKQPPTTGQKIATTKAMTESLNVTLVNRTPSENSIKGIVTWPSISIGRSMKRGKEIPKPLIKAPTITASNIGVRSISKPDNLPE